MGIFNATFGGNLDATFLVFWQYYANFGVINALTISRNYKLKKCVLASAFSICEIDRRSQAYDSSYILGHMYKRVLKHENNV